MKTDPSLTRAALSLVNVFALLCGALLLPLPASGQTTTRTPSTAATPARDHKGKPVVISFGQPNIWSLDQAHYLLSQLRERSLSLTAKDLTELDPNETHGTRIDFMRQLFELVTEFKQPAPAPSPGASPAQTPTAFPAGTPERVASTDTLQGSLLSSILSDADLRKRLFSDPKLNAITRLDNHIQLQYEIVARQLTLLRDEVRPGERLVFLELPQSIYTADDKADDKLVQVWWQVEGYSEKNVRKKLEDAITLTSARINALLADPSVSSLASQEKSIRDRIEEEERLRYLQEEAGEGVELKAADRERLSVLMADPPDMSTHPCHSERVKDFCRGNSGEPCRQRRDACSKYRELSYWEQSREALEREAREEKDRDFRRAVESLVQRGPADFGELPAGTGEKAAEAAEKYSEVGNADNAAARTAVRTIDIIPHQSSLNVNDVQETVKSSFIAASFSFLFGLGARTSFQRQRDQFEQFLHQELYASGFGKGDSLFGWTFGPIPGTKRVAPGLRTTFAALIVPDKADSIMLRARGCFFHREDNEPPDPFGQGPERRWWDNNDRECGGPRQYRLRIPGGGERENFWVSGIEYVPFKSPGQRMVALIKGQNFTTQVGVLVNGVPLRSVVELTRKLPASARYDANANCPTICGEYEVIGQNDISIAFEMPDGFVGTPEITVAGAGRTVTLNHLPLLVRPYGEGTFPSLSGEDTPFMFGNGPPVRINEIKLFRDPTSSAPNEFILGVLRGRRRLNGSETIFVNGKPLNSSEAVFDRHKRLYQLRFGNPGDAKLDVIVVSGTSAETRTLVNPFEDMRRPAPLAVTGEEILALDAAQGEMAVRLTGTGLARATVQVVSGAAGSEITSQSATELILRLMQPRVAVKIRLTNPAGDQLTRAIIRRAPPRSVIERRDRTDEGNN